MITLLAIALCLLEVAASNYMGVDPWAFYNVWQVEFPIISALGLACVYDGGHRGRSLFAGLLVWFGVTALTDWALADPHDLYLLFQPYVFSMLVLWALVRPYFFASQSMTPWNVTLVFYQGRNAPVLSELSSLVGLPFSSVAIIARGKILRAKKDGFLHMTDSRWVNKKDYVFVDSGIKATKEHLDAMRALEGSPVKRFGLRTGCVAALRPLLELIGMEPKTKFHLLPSIFYSQCVRKANG